MRYRTLKLLACLWLSVPVIASAKDITVNDRHFVLPDGLEIELVAGPPLVDRPICCDFDEQGRLYVAESSGSNDKVAVQLEQRPHRILRLEDTDGDGRFDSRTVFADGMMFPEGTMWLNGSLYVAAPPSIWKLTDTDNDGIVDEREEWFEGRTLTGCANDLHGPYHGPDGWVYWCKGAFAEQTHEQPGRKPLVTKASHIFRRRPEGGPIESVMAGGMDNPVEVVFTPGGERIFTTTFLQHPSGGRRDGLIHALYGGVYGKRHGVLDGHKRTGELMPALTHLGAAAPCGLARLESAGLGAAYQYNVLACLFNMHKVTRHVLELEGATFRTRDEDFVVSDNLDFHPTDAIEDADGSLLVVDTGGWYKLCCPTSQLWKPDVLGAIYRVRRTGANPIEDAWGQQIAWDKATPAEVAERLGDSRHAVRRRAADVLSHRGAAAVPAIAQLLETAPAASTRLAAVWALTRIDAPVARAAVRRALQDHDADVRQAAIHSVSVRRDHEAHADLLALLEGSSPHNARAAAEALGRTGNAETIGKLLTAADRPHDRALEHSLTFALIELSNPSQTAEGLTSDNPFVRRAALVALDQMDEGGLSAEQVVPHLSASQPELRTAAAWITEHHPDWAPQLTSYFRAELTSEMNDERREELTRHLIAFAGQAATQELLARTLSDSATAESTRLLVLRIMAQSGQKQLPGLWLQPLAASMQSGSEAVVAQAVATARSFEPVKSPDAAWTAALHQIGDNARYPTALRLEALAATGGGAAVDEATFNMLLDHLGLNHPVATRSLAADVLAQGRLNNEQLGRLADAVSDVGPLELERVLATFTRSQDEKLGLRLTHSLRRSTAAASLPGDKLLARFASFPATVQTDARELQKSLEMSVAQQREQLQSLLASLPAGDVRRGQQVFHSEKAACYACHAMGYLGGNIGPDLTRIGGIRQDRDLLESILYPSASFVRSYEPVNVVTTSGVVITGLLREDNGLEVVITTSERKNVRLTRDEIEEIQPGTVSVMPAGLDKQLTPQQLADLLEFLRSTR